MSSKPIRPTSRLKPYAPGLLTRLLASRDARKYYTLNDIWRVCSGAATVPPGVLKRMRSMYAHSVRYLDAWVGRLLDQLERTDRLENTLVLVLSDHGENFGEGGLIAHGVSLDDRLIRVPFIVAGPGADRLRLNSLADLPRALAESVGIEDHPWNDGLPEGFAAAQFDPPVPFDDETGREALRSIGIEGAHLDRFLTPLTCVVKEELKLVRRGQLDEVFDLAQDPLEARPLSPADQERRAEAIADLRRVIDLPAVTTESTSHEAEPKTPSPQELQDLEARMRLLGYL